MSRKQHVVRLSVAQRTECIGVLSRGTTPALTQRRARILLQTDCSQPGPRLTDGQVATAVLVDPRTVARVRSQFATAGFDRALGRRPQRPTPHKLDGGQAARLITLACSTPPPGHARWSLRLLAQRAVELEIVDGISHETVRTTLKKTSSNRG